ncbi:MAG: LCP family protein [Microthrixaceae bacterium]|nr:LCP family protein [Microthrixaceae bacterium]
MATVVTITDRDGFDNCTDNIVVVQPARRRLLWVPRDVWCENREERINASFKGGSHQRLIEDLKGLGIDVDHSLCLSRSAVERALSAVDVSVPVAQPLRFWYPMSPTERIQDGRKPVDFLPPSERLRGERVHQWIGARHVRDSSTPGSDLARIRRQQVLVRRLLREHFVFSAVLADPDAWKVSDRQAMVELGRVRWWWHMACTDQVADRNVAGQQVLELMSPEPKPPRWRRALLIVRSRLVGLGQVGRG